MNYALEELKDAMKPKHRHEFEMRLRQGEIIKSNIKKSDYRYIFEFVLKTRYGGRLVAGYYSRNRGMTYECDADIRCLEVLLDWAEGG